MNMEYNVGFTKATENMEKYFIEGRGYGVLISPGYGFEFSARMRNQSIAIDKRVIEAAYECADAVVPCNSWGTDFDDLRGFDTEKFSKMLYELGYFEDDGEPLYITGNFSVEFLHEGTMLKIREHDGSEHIEIFDPTEWIQL